MPIYKMNGKKDGKQKYRVRVNYIDNLGKAKQIDRVAYGLEDAKQLERELNYSLKEETPTAKMTVNDLYEEYIKSKRHEVRETTLDTASRTIKRYVIPHLDTTRIDKLTAPKLQEWKQKIEELGLSIVTRQNIYGAFCAMLNYAVKLEYIPKNPLSLVGNFKAPLEMKKEMQYYTAEEFKAIYQNCKRKRHTERK